MLISRELATAFNQQIGNEFGASMQYVSIAAHFSQRHLQLLAKLFFEQADEEKTHAMKFVKYLLDTKAELRIPAIPAPTPTFASAEEAVQAALNWEQEVTKQITALMDIAVKENDYLGASFLQWFIDEQLEEVVKMERLLSVIRQSGETQPADGRSVPDSHRQGRIAAARQERVRYFSSRTQMLRKLIGGLGSPCACSLIGAVSYVLYSGLPM